MNVFTPAETAANYAAAGVLKTRQPFLKLLLLGIAAGALIVEEAGGSIKNYDGSPLTDYFAVQSVFALANPKIPILKV